MRKVCSWKYIFEDSAKFSDHPFSTYAKYSKKLLFLTPWYAPVQDLGVRNFSFFESLLNGWSLIWRVEHICKIYSRKYFFQWILSRWYLTDLFPSYIFINLDNRKYNGFLVFSGGIIEKQHWKHRLKAHLGSSNFGQ